MSAWTEPFAGRIWPVTGADARRLKSPGAFFLIFVDEAEAVHGVGDAVGCTHYMA